MTFSFKSLFAIRSLSPQRFHYHFYLGIVFFWQLQKYSIILILVLCLWCVTLFVRSSYSSFAPSSPLFKNISETKPIFTNLKKKIRAHRTSSKATRLIKATSIKQLITKKFVSYLHIPYLFCNILYRRRRNSPRRPLYLLIVGLHYWFMRFAYALHVRR